MKMWCCNCMGKHTRSEFFEKNPHVFTILHFFCKKKIRYCAIKQLPIMWIWWFLQYLGSMRTNEENTACSEWKYTFQRNSEGKQEGKNARGRGVGALLLLLLPLLLWIFIINTVGYCMGIAPWSLALVMFWWLSLFFFRRELKQVVGPFYTNQNTGWQWCDWRHWYTNVRSVWF